MVAKMLLHPFALVFAASFLSAAVTASAVAADKLASECCADLEERIAELESTAAKAGTRKVKLTIAGFLNEAIMFWNDGVESIANVVTNDNGRGRIQFRGVGKIDKEWSAGFRLELGVRIEYSKRFTSRPPERGLDIRHALWFIESKKYGRISVGNTAARAKAPPK